MFEGLKTLNYSGMAVLAIFLFAFLNHMFLWLNTAAAFYSPAHATDTTLTPSELKTGEAFEHAAPPAKDLIWLFSMMHKEMKKVSKLEHSSLTVDRAALTTEAKDNLRTLAIIQFILYTIIAAIFAALIASFASTGVRAMVFDPKSGMSSGYQFN
jgi:hypothetical protein